MDRAEDDLAAFLYTSGTTGRSKGAMLTQANLLSNALTLTDLWRFTASDVLLHALPIFHTHGLFVAINTVLAAGASMIVYPKLDARRDARRHAPRHRHDGRARPSTPASSRSPASPARPTADMRLFVSGSAPLLAETHRQWEARTGHRILERYGMTETNMTASNPYDGERRAGTVGHPLPGVEIRINEPGDRGTRTAGRNRRARGPRPQRLQGLLADARENRRRAAPRRLVHHRRPRPGRTKTATSSSSGATRT